MAESLHRLLARNHRAAANPANWKFCPPIEDEADSRVPAIDDILDGSATKLGIAAFIIAHMRTPKKNRSEVLSRALGVAMSKAPTPDEIADEQVRLWDARRKLRT